MLHFILSRPDTCHGTHLISNSWIVSRLVSRHYRNSFQTAPLDFENQNQSTGKSFSEALILVSTNPQYDKRLFIELRVQYMKIPSSEHVENMLCTQIVFCFDIQNNLCTQHVLNMFSTCSQHVLSLQFSCTELVIQWKIFCYIVG